MSTPEITGIIKSAVHSSGGIKKTLLTPCRRIGLSRNRKTPNSSFTSPLESKPIDLTNIIETSSINSKQSPNICTTPTIDSKYNKKHNCKKEAENTHDSARQTCYTTSLNKNLQEQDSKKEDRQTNENIIASSKKTNFAKSKQEPQRQPKIKRCLNSDFKTNSNHTTKDVRIIINSNECDDYINQNKHSDSVKKITSSPGITSQDICIRLDKKKRKKIISDSDEQINAINESLANESQNRNIENCLNTDYKYDNDDDDFIYKKKRKKINIINSQENDENYIDQNLDKNVLSKDEDLTNEPQNRNIMKLNTDQEGYDNDNDEFIYKNKRKKINVISSESNENHIDQSLLEKVVSDNNKILADFNKELLEGTRAENEKNYSPEIISESNDLTETSKHQQVAIDHSYFKSNDDQTNENLRVSDLQKSEDKSNKNVQESLSTENPKFQKKSSKTIKKKLSMKKSLSSSAITDESDEELFTNSPILQNKVDDFTNMQEIEMVDVILELEKTVHNKEAKLQKLQQVQIYRNLHKLEDLVRETNVWKIGCQDALKDLLGKLREHANIDMRSLLQNLRAPLHLFKYDPENDNFL